MFKSIFYIIFLKFISVQAFKMNGDFNLAINKGIISNLVNTTNFIKSLKQGSKMSCLAACNLDSLCLTSVFYKNTSSLVNCFMYNIYFLSNETLGLFGSELFEKKSSKI